jgi:hypothetical protein
MTPRSRSLTVRALIIARSARSCCVNPRLVRCRRSKIPNGDGSILPIADRFLRYSESVPDHTTTVCGQSVSQPVDISSHLAGKTRTLDDRKPDGDMQSGRVDNLRQVAERENH